MSEDLSQKMRVYLAEIYRLADLQDQLDGYISTAALSEVLDVTAPAVNRMINRLKELNLLDHQPYQGIRLTEAGKLDALQQSLESIITPVRTAGITVSAKVIHADYNKTL